MNKFPAVYSRIECISLEIALECLNNIVELKTVMFFIAFKVWITIKIESNNEKIFV